MAKRKKKNFIEMENDIEIMADKFWGRLAKYTKMDEYLMFLAIDNLRQKLIDYGARKNKLELERYYAENKDTGN